MDIIKYTGAVLEKSGDVLTVSIPDTFSHLKETFNSQIGELCATYKVRKVRFKFVEQKRVAVMEHKVGDKVPPPHIDVEIVTNLDNLHYDLDEYWALDFETDSDDPLTCNIIGVGLTSVETYKTYYVPINGSSLMSMIAFLKTMVGYNCIFVVHNLGFEDKILKRMGIHAQLRDTMILGYIEDSSQFKSLKKIVKKKYAINMTTFKEVLGKRKNFSEVPVEEAAQYCGADTFFTAQLFNDLADVRRTLLCDLDHRAAIACSQMETIGVHVDLKRLETFGMELTRQIDLVENKMYELVGREFNIRSPKQMVTVLYEDLGIDDKKKYRNKAGNLSTDEKTIQKIVADGFKHPVLALLLCHRGLAKLKSTYVDGMTLKTDSDTGIFHPTFNFTGAETGRLSGDLQQLPASGMGKEVRRCIIPTNENYVFSTADYSQIELRVLAHIMGDEQVIDLFRQGYDMHAATASAIFDKPIESIEKDSYERTVGKTMNFAIIYGQGEAATGRSLGITTKEALDLQEKYFKRFPLLAEKIDGYVKFCRTNGYVETLLGRRRYLPRINDYDHFWKSRSERQTFNHVIQGTAADVARCGMIRLHEELLPMFDGRARLVMQVHDEFVSEVLNNDVESYNVELARLLENPFMIDGRRILELNVPLVVDIGVASTYGDSK
jgi:DNA polymerase-1